MIKANQPHIFDKTKLRAWVSSKQDGTMKSNNADDLQEVSAAIEAVAQQGEFSYDRIVAMNVGTPDIWDDIVDITSSPGRAMVSIADRIPADALVTTRTDVVLMLPVADCNAVAIHDPVRQVLSLVHLGWQSTEAELATKIITYLVNHHGSNPSDLRIYVSPSIRSESYVFDKVKQGDDSAWQPFLHKTEKGVGIDLPGYNRQRFIDAGVPADSIEICPVNTATSGDYFSHYRAVRTGEFDGRFALFAQLI